MSGSLAWALRTTDLESSSRVTGAAFVVETGGVSVRDAAGWTRSEGATLDARAYGARGDGVSDDREAIQRCIELAASAGGGTVVLPAGRYGIRSNLSMRSRVRLLGEGPGRTCIQARSERARPERGAPTCPVSPAAGDAFTAIDVTRRVRREDGSISYEHVEDVVIEGIELHAAEGSGIRAKKVVRLTIRDVVVHSAGAYGIAVEYFADHAESRDLLFQRVEVHHNGQDGIDVKRATGICLEQVVAHHNGRYGIDVRGMGLVADTLVAHDNRWSGIVFSCHSNADHPTRAVARNLVAYRNGWSGDAAWPDEDPEGSCDEHLRDGISLYDSVDVRASQLVLASVHAEGNARHGVSIQHHDQHVTLRSVIARDNGGSGIAIAGAGHRVSITSGELGENAGSGVVLLAPVSSREPTHVSMVGTHACANGAHGVAVDDAPEHAYDLQVSGCSLDDNRGWGVLATSADLTLVGCTLIGNGLGAARIGERAEVAHVLSRRRG